MSSDAGFPFTWPVDTAVKPDVEKAVDYLLQHWTVARGMLNINDTSMSKDVLSLFARRALDCPTNIVSGIPDGTWTPAQPGRLQPGDIVRVHSDAFSGHAGMAHNNRIGEVLWVEAGDVVVASRDGKEPTLTKARYSPHVLDRLHTTAPDGRQ